MLKKLVYIGAFAMVLAGCLKTETPDAQYEYQKRLDDEMMEDYLRSHRMMADSFAIERIAYDGEGNFWSSMFEGVDAHGNISEDTEYSDLVGHLFRDSTVINEFLNGDTLSAQTGIFVYILEEGGRVDPDSGELLGGKQPTDTSTVRLLYEGSLLNGDIFDTTYGRTDKGELFYTSRNFNLRGGLIEGWKFGIPYFKTGVKDTFTVPDAEGNDSTFVKWNDTGKGVLFIPSRMAYGETPNGAIAPNSNLVFTIDLWDKAESTND